MTQNTPAQVEAMQLRWALSAAQKKLDISEKLIDELQHDPLSNNDKSSPSVDKDFRSPFSMAFLNDL
jgi:hypothetical protein